MEDFGTLVLNVQGLIDPLAYGKCHILFNQGMHVLPKLARVDSGTYIQVDSHRFIHVYQVLFTASLCLSAWTFVQGLDALFSSKQQSKTNRYVTIYRCTCMSF